MSNLRFFSGLPMAATLLAALMLMIMPLPASADAFRPDWVVLATIYWAMMAPERYAVGVAWFMGLLLDVSQGTLLGQHALALSVIAYITVKLHLQLRVFPVSQMTITVFALLALYQFLLFWINGVAGVSAPSVAYWGPVITGTIFWPVVSILLAGIRFRVQTRG